MTELKLPVFFAGVMSADGYCSRLDGIYDPDDGWRAYLIKGGAGMGKSTLMKALASDLTSRGARAELIACPSDPNSLDAVIFPDLKTAVMDATAPHIVNPKYPEVCEVIVNLADCCDHEKMRALSGEALPVYKRLSALYARASRYVAAIGALSADTFRIAYDCLDVRKAAQFGAHLAEKNIPLSVGRGREQVRFLSSATPLGLMHLSDTVGMMCDRVIAVEDECGAASRVILSAVRMTALERGADIITCMCPFAPDDKVEHIIIPELRLAFVTQNSSLKTPTGERIVHARRFTDAAQLHQKRQRLKFNRRAVSELIRGTVQTLAQAKATHDELEKLYVANMDFAAVTDRLLEIEASIA